MPLAALVIERNPANQSVRAVVSLPSGTTMLLAVMNGNVFDLDPAIGQKFEQFANDTVHLLYAAFLKKHNIEGAAALVETMDGVTGGTLQ